MAARIRKSDKVIVLSGKDKGRVGEVLRVIPKESRVVVQGVNVVARHTRPSWKDPGGIKRVEAPIHESKVTPVDPKTGKATRVGFKLLDDGRKVRVAKRSGEVIDR